MTPSNYSCFKYRLPALPCPRCKVEFFIWIVVPRKGGYVTVKSIIESFLFAKYPTIRNRHLEIVRVKSDKYKGIFGNLIEINITGFIT